MWRLSEAGRRDWRRRFLRRRQRHERVSPRDFSGSQNIVRNILAAFDVADTAKWFATLGVELKREETGKLFPVSDSARTVLDALLSRCAQLGVIIHTGSRVSAIEA